MPDAVLALNAGSSSIKFGLFEIDKNELTLLSRGEMEGIGVNPHFIAHDAKGAVLSDRSWPGEATADHEILLGRVLDWVDAHLAPDVLIGVGHRVVHGGADFTAPVRLDEDVMTRLAALTPLAPLHQPHSLSPVGAISTLRPDLPQIACFDTAFHQTMPAVATRFALPRDLAAQGVRRYGFHGLSYEFIARRLRQTLPHLAAGRVIVAHLGNGASLCAMQAGCSRDTSMGFTALDGLMMGTRCGTLDPGVLLYLLQENGLSASAVSDLLYKQSGLLGVSGVSSDMRKLLATDTAPAREAVELFIYRIVRETAALIASLGGLDGFIFTAGIGEHAAEIRHGVCGKLSWLGARFDHEANARAAECISLPDSRVEIRIVPTDEEAMIAQHTTEMLRNSASNA